jgi:anion-transporting  ArsA/GET3 family ATPase
VSLTRLDSIVTSKEILIACGPGGVGKTTMAASNAIKIACDYEKKVLVLTVDPAKRLATALGLKALGNQEYKINLSDQLGPKVKGELWAAMLDTKESWDQLIERYSPDKVTADKILSNPLYKDMNILQWNVYTSFTQRQNTIL